MAGHSRANILVFEYTTGGLYTRSAVANSTSTGLDPPEVTRGQISGRQRGHDRE